MAQNKAFTMKQYNGTDYDTYYPETTISQVDNLQTTLNSKVNVPVVVTGTLTAGETSITLTNSAITTTSILDIYTDIYGVAPKTMVASTGSVTMTFRAQESDLGIRLEVK